MRCKWLKIKIAILVFGCISATAQDSLTSGGNFIGTSGAGPYGGYNSAEQQEEVQKRNDALRLKLKTEKELAAYNFIPKDPWRKIDGQTNYAKGDGWVIFSGNVLEVQATGIRVEGVYGWDSGNAYTSYSGVFFRCWISVSGC